MGNLKVGADLWARRNKCMVVQKSVLNFVRWRIFEKFSPNPLPPSMTMMIFYWDVKKMSFFSWWMRLRARLVGVLWFWFSK